MTDDTVVGGSTWKEMKRKIVYTKGDYHKASWFVSQLFNKFQDMDLQINS